jgi:hypothetical protein
MEQNPFTIFGMSTGTGIGVAGLLISIALPLAQYVSANRAADLRHKETNVKVAIGILSEKAPRDKAGNVQEFPAGEQELRKWALRQLNRNAEQSDEIQGDAADDLIKGVSKLTQWRDSGSYYTGGYTTYGTYDYDMPDVQRKQATEQKSEAE